MFIVFPFFPQMRSITKVTSTIPFSWFDLRKSFQIGPSRLIPLSSLLEALNMYSCHPTKFCEPSPHPHFQSPFLKDVARIQLLQTLASQESITIVQSPCLSNAVLFSYNILLFHKFCSFFFTELECHCNDILLLTLENRQLSTPLQRSLRAVFVSVTALMVCCNYPFTHLSPPTGLWDCGQLREDVFSGSSLEPNT